MIYLTQCGPRHRVHTSRTGRRPDCGGGRGGRSVQWQTDIGPANCAACRRVKTIRRRPVKAAGLATYFQKPSTQEAL